MPKREPSGNKIQRSHQFLNDTFQLACSCNVHQLISVRGMVLSNNLCSLTKTHRKPCGNVAFSLQEANILQVRFCQNCTTTKTARGMFPNALLSKWRPSTDMTAKLSIDHLSVEIALCPFLSIDPNTLRNKLGLRNTENSLSYLQIEEILLLCHSHTR